MKLQTLTMIMMISASASASAQPSTPLLTTSSGHDNVQHRRLKMMHTQLRLFNRGAIEFWLPRHGKKALVGNPQVVYAALMTQMDNNALDPIEVASAWSIVEQAKGRRISAANADALRSALLAQPKPRTEVPVLEATPKPVEDDSSDIPTFVDTEDIPMPTEDTPMPTPTTNDAKTPVPMYDHDHVPMYDHDHIPIYDHDHVPMYDHDHIPIYDHDHVPMYDRHPHHPYHYNDLSKDYTSTYDKSTPNTNNHSRDYHNSSDEDCDPEPVSPLTDSDCSDDPVSPLTDSDCSDDPVSPLTDSDEDCDDHDSKPVSPTSGPYVNPTTTDSKYAPEEITAVKPEYPAINPAKVLPCDSEMKPANTAYQPELVMNSAVQSPDMHAPGAAMVTATDGSTGKPSTTSVEDQSTSVESSESSELSSATSSAKVLWTPQNAAEASEVNLMIPVFSMILCLALTWL